MRKIFTLIASIILATSAWAQSSITVSEDTESEFVPTAIINGDFSTEPFMNFVYNSTTYTLSNKNTSVSGVTITSSIPNGINGGWNTTETKPYVGSLFEFSSNATHYNSNLPTGNNCVEMNVYNSAVLYQDLSTNSHDVIRWTLKHAVRTNMGDEVQAIRVEVGAPEYSGTNIVPASGINSEVNSHIQSSSKVIYRASGITNPSNATYGFNGSNLGKLSLSKSSSSDNASWHTVTGVYVIPAGQTVTRFSFIAETVSNPDLGNLLDDLTFSTLIGNLSAQQLANNDVEVKGYWGETDTSKKFKVVIDGVVHEIDMSSVSGRNFRILIPASIVGTATSVEAYHQDYQVAENTIAVTPVYHSGLQSGTEDASNWTISPAVAEAGATINVTYSGSLLRPASVATTPIASSWTMEYTGTIQPFTAPATGEYELQVWGAQGGSHDNSNAGGLGGYATCRTNLNEGETIYIYVGGQGGMATKGVGGYGGWNGGGAGGNGHPNYQSGGGGGGATHISKVNNQVIGGGSGQCASLAGSNFIIVAGGGGGAGWASTTPGVGGGTEASKGTKVIDPGSSYATYSSNYYYNASQSYGANGGNAVQDHVYSCAAESAGGGGGGYYGGNAYCAYSNFPANAYQNAAGCGGGSAHNSGLATNYSATAGVRSGNGKAEIRLISVTGEPTLTEATKVDNNHWQYAIPNYNVNLVVEYHPWEGTGAENDPYLISSTDDWNLLADKVNGGKIYAGVYFQQTADISVTTPVGSFTDESHYKTFNGIYDGNGHTLAVSISISDKRYVAPFHYISGATIKNLIVTGSVTVSGTGGAEAWRHPGGLVGATEAGSTNLIENCRVSVNVSGSDYIGGIVGNALNSSLTIRGCVYSGTITANGALFAGGLLGWGGGGSGKTVSIRDCIFCGSYSGSGNFHPVGCYFDPANFTRSVSNTYYTVAPSNMMDDHGNSFVKNLSYKGKLCYIITGSSDVMVSNAGSATEYNVSGITSYGTGILYGGELYGGNGDVISLNLDHADAPVGHSFSHYSVDHGNLTGSSNPYTLTMANADAVISANWSVNQYTITFNSNGGSAVDPITQDYNTAVTAPAAPTKTGYIFAGWDPAVPSTMPAEDITLTAQWNVDTSILLNDADVAMKSILNALMDSEPRDINIGRSISRDGNYSTLCLPFSLDASQIAASPLNGFVICELTDMWSVGNELRLLMTQKSSIEAGMPYLVRYAQTPTDPISLVFQGVTVTASEGGQKVAEGAKMHGVLEPTLLERGNKNILFLMANNIITWPNSDNAMKAFRAYFDVTPTPKTSTFYRGMPTRIVEQRETPTGMEIVESGESRVESTKILRDGQLVIICGDREFNAQGQILK